jgi:hypothetical protein
LQKNEIKNSKKTRVHFKIFGQNRIQKFKVMCPRRFGEVKNDVKIERKKKEKPRGFPKNRSVILKTIQFFIPFLQRCFDICALSWCGVLRF